MTIILTRKGLRASMVFLALAATVLLTALFIAGGPFAQSALATDSGNQSMYRLYNPNSGEHFYTADANERYALEPAGWNYEGVGWIAPETSSTPVYRLYSGTDHHYTMDANEKSALEAAGWKYEGIGWYSSDDRTDIPLYRQFNPNVNPGAAMNNSGSHNYTTSKKENDSLVSNGWKGEGVSWYAVGEGQLINPAEEALNANPSSVPGTNKNENAPSAKLTGTVQVQYCDSYFGGGNVCYLDLPKSVNLTGTQYDMREDKVILPESLSAYKGRTVTISSHFSGRPTASIKEASISPIWAYDAQIVRLF